MNVSGSGKTLDPALDSVAKTWWQEKARGYPDGGIPPRVVADLIPQFCEIAGCNREEAIEFVQKSGIVLGDAPSKPQQVVPAITKRRMNKQKQGDTSVEKAEFEGLTQKELVQRFWAETDGGDPQLLVKKFRGIGRVVSVQSVYTAKSALLKSGWKPPETKPATAKTRPVKKILGRKPQRVSEGRSVILSALDDEIRALEAQIQKTTQEVETLKKARRVLET